VDPHIFADPDPGSQNLADPTDPDPKHWFFSYKKPKISKFLLFANFLLGESCIFRISSPFYCIFWFFSEICFWNWIW